MSAAKAKKKQQAITLGLSNQKGGAAKTTTAAALAAIYTQNGLRVLCVDNDPQGHLSLQLGVDSLSPDFKTRATVSDIYTGKAQVSEVAIQTASGIDLIPASVELAEREMLLSTMAGTDLRLRVALEPARASYDMIILDSPPNLGKLAVNVLTACDYFIVPVDGPWALRSVDTIVQLARQNAQIYKLPAQFLGVFLTIVDRTRIMQSVREEVSQRYPDRLLKSEIRRSTLARESAALETPLPLYASDSSVAADYRALAAEVAERIGLAFN